MRARREGWNNNNNNNNNNNKRLLFCCWLVCLPLGAWVHWYPNTHTLTVLAFFFFFFSPHANNAAKRGAANSQKFGCDIRNNLPFENTGHHQIPETCHKRKAEPAAKKKKKKKKKENEESSPLTQSSHKDTSSSSSSSPSLFPSPSPTHTHARTHIMEHHTSSKGGSSQPPALSLKLRLPTASHPVHHSDPMSASVDSTTPTISSASSSPSVFNVSLRFSISIQREMGRQTGERGRDNETQRDQEKQRGRGAETRTHTYKQTHKVL